MSRSNNTPLLLGAGALGLLIFAAVASSPCVQKVWIGVGMRLPLRVTRAPSRTKDITCATAFFGSWMTASGSRREVMMPVSS